ncbi:Tudor domain-containing protein [Caenorhabditis elegans]|uniref:Tudor domain-containing protein n=1 Tax=Caenorhabditis elegans TaxID=6239 RepID=Q8MYN4_CAEEL|nr:Tudor domain-containing protein [Caenorhabditis elegans]CAD31822.2 Tudor domain-containing protein [Caenorhabditis elegans]|eukprot:NP_741669.2 Uncharacterized protein CELE_Y39B6A.25 [Caenorhabditis elegans]
MEFGGGLGRFVGSATAPNLCREIIEVPGGAEWKIRNLQETAPEFSWKYPGSSVIVNYHFKRLQNLDSPIFDENEKMFYGKVSHFMSPVEISLQPKYLSTARKSIMEQLNATYQSTQVAEFQEDQIFVPVACAVQELGIWYRGRIAQISGEAHVVVELIDFGTQILVPRHKVLPLTRRFGRAPPLCLKCRVAGLSINDLEIKDLHDFKNIIEECQALFRVEIKSVDEPHLIDLYHPTIAGRNVCQQFFRRPEDVAKLDRIERSWETHCKKMNEEFDDDEDFEEEHGDGDYFPTSIQKPHLPEIPRQQYIKRLPKCQRAPRFEQDLLLIEHIENSQLVYLQYPWQREKRQELDKALHDAWHTLPSVPKDLRTENQLVAISNRRLRGGMVCRGVICEDDTVLLVDYGRYVRCPTNGDFRLLPAHGLFMEEPMVTVISLVRGVNLHNPHHSETQFLHQKLPRGAHVHFRWDKKSKTTPLRGKLISNGACLNDQMVKFLESQKIDGHCRQLDIYRPRVNHKLPRDNHVYRSMCHPHYSKGIKEFLWI